MLTVVSLAVTGTYARFIDTEASQENAVQAGSLELILENPWQVGESRGHSVLRTWHYENLLPEPGLMEPGDVLTSQVEFKAFGSGQAECIDIQCINVNSEPDFDTEPENEAEDTILGYDVPRDAGYGILDKDTVMIITGMSYHTQPIIWGEYDSFDGAIFTDINGDHRISLDEFEDQGIKGLTPPPNLGNVTFSMTIKFATTMLRNGETVDVGNEYQGDQTEMTLIFTLR